MNLGVIETYKRSKRHLLNHYKRGFFFKIRNKNDWLKIKNKYNDKRVFIIGNGPSLNETELYLLKNDYSICFNRFSLMLERLNFIPNFYMNTDPIVAENISDEINTLIPDFEMVFIPDIHTNGLDYRKIISNKKNVYWMQPDFKGFYFNLPNVSLGGTVAYSALQVLVYLGFKEIYFIGTDMKYKIEYSGKLVNKIEVQSNRDDDINHFDPRYFGSGKKYHLPDDSVIQNILNYFKYSKKIIDNKKNIIIKNATIGGDFDVFDRCEFNKLFSYSSKEKENLFLESLNNNTNLNFRSYNNLLGASKEIFSEQDINGSNIYYFYRKNSQKLISKLILSYKIFGPFDDKFFLIKR